MKTGKTLTLIAVCLMLCGCISPTVQMDVPREKRESVVEKYNREREERWADEKRTRLEYLQNTNILPHVRFGIEQRMAVVGMTKHEVKLCYGNPPTASTTSSANWNSEVWSYGFGRLVFFEDERVTAVQERKIYR